MSLGALIIIVAIMLVALKIIKASIKLMISAAAIFGDAGGKQQGLSTSASEL